MLMLENNMGVGLNIAERAMDFDFTHMIAKITLSHTNTDVRVIKAYIGQEI